MIEERAASERMLDKLRRFVTDQLDDDERRVGGWAPFLLREDAEEGTHHHDLLQPAAGRSGTNSSTSASGTTRAARRPPSIAARRAIEDNQCLKLAGSRRSPSDSKALVNTSYRRSRRSSASRTRSARIVATNARYRRYSSLNAAASPSRAAVTSATSELSMGHQPNHDEGSLTPCPAARYAARDPKERAHRRPASGRSAIAPGSPRPGR
ncbi:hypothetical protein BH23ACT9_BH23ACT9_17460 [soil metagenome]